MSDLSAFAAIACAPGAPWDCAAAYRVWLCESGGDWGNATNPLHSGGFQISPTWHEAKVEAVTGRELDWAGTYEALLDAEVNIAVAQTIYADSGWGPWSCRPGG